MSVLGYDVKVEVKPEYITNGTRCHSGKCPIGLALQNIFPSAAIMVGCADALIIFKDLTLSGTLPMAAQQFIRDFDADRPAHPFEFILSATDDSSPVSEQVEVSQTRKPVAKESFPAQDNFTLSQDSTPQRNKLIDTIRTLDEYETTILQAYANNLIKSRKERA